MCKPQSDTGEGEANRQREQIIDKVAAVQRAAAQPERTPAPDAPEKHAALDDAKQIVADIEKRTTRGATRSPKNQRYFARRIIALIDRHAADMTTERDEAIKVAEFHARRVDALLAERERRESRIRAEAYDEGFNEGATHGRSERTAELEAERRIIYDETREKVRRWDRVLELERENEELKARLEEAEMGVVCASGAEHELRKANEAGVERRLLALEKAIEGIWEAHRIVTMNLGAGWKRHVEPAIYNAHRVLRDKRE